MSLVDLQYWLDTYIDSQSIWYIKRLSADDTFAKHALRPKQRFPTDFILRIFPRLKQPNTINPSITFDMLIDSHQEITQATAIWYNSKIRSGTRNETWLTTLGDSSFALLNPESTGAVAIYVFLLNKQKTMKECHAWVCENESEEERIEDLVGPVEPDQYTIWVANETAYSNLAPRVTRLAFTDWLNRSEFLEE